LNALAPVISWTGELGWPGDEELVWEPDMTWELGMHITTVQRKESPLLTVESLGSY